MQVDKGAAAQKLVKLDLSGCIPAHEAFERRRFVGRKVVDMRPWVASPGRHCQIDKLLEGRPLLLKRLRPQRSVDEIAVGVGYHVAEEVFLDPFHGEVVAFKVEEDVVAGRHGQEGQTVLGAEGFFQFVIGLVRSASNVLHPRLLPDTH